jgi:hypothetical protein
MSIQTKFDLYISELDKKISDLIEEEVNKDLSVVNNILDISQPYQDELGLNFTIDLYYDTSLAPIQFSNGSYEYDKNHKLVFGDLKRIVRSINRGYINIHIHLDPKKAKWGPDFQKNTDRFKNNILKFYPNFGINIRKYILIINYRRDDI